ncbi:MAG TPA: S1/P1 nuclease [Planctomycetaceae bacterium]|nr:S1/P1 nuclease [Planctomycetaceae bacterium]
MVAEPARLWAWGKEGHIIVAAIAQQHLTPEARQGVQRILGSAHIYDDDVANWPDMIRPTQRETAPWHFIDIPISRDVLDMNRDCANRDCVIDKIEDFRQALMDPTVSREDRFKALKFVVHFVGDVHQPLHCEDNADRGGNKIFVRYAGPHRKPNLHAVWDTSIIQDAMGEQSITEYAAALDDSITQDQIQQWLTLSDPGDWANESHKLAQTVYAALTIPSHGTLQLPGDYGAVQKGTVEVQLQRAGIRLAKLLNDVFTADASQGGTLAMGARGTNGRSRTVPVIPKTERPRLESRMMSDDDH